MTQKMQHFSLKVLTINIHKGFTAFNRRFILPELRDAVRTVSADIVCLQEVMGAHEVHPLHFENWPDTPHYEFLADTMWSDYAYGRNAVYPEGHHGNAVLSRYPIEHYENRDVSVGESEKTRPALLPHYAARPRATCPCRLCSHGPSRSPSSGAAENAGRMGQRPSRRRTCGGSGRFQRLETEGKPSVESRCRAGRDFYSRQRQACAHLPGPFPAASA